MFLYFNFEYGFQHLAASEKNDLLNYISQKIIKAIRKRKFNRVISQIVGKVSILVILQTTFYDSFPFRLFKFPTFQLPLGEIMTNLLVGCLLFRKGYTN